MGLFLNILSMLLNNNSSQQRMNNAYRQILENEIGKQRDILGQEIEREEKHLKKVRSQLDKDIEFLKLPEILEYIEKTPFILENHDFLLCIDYENKLKPTNVNRYFYKVILFH